MYNKRASPYGLALFSKDLDIFGQIFIGFGHFFRIIGHFFNSFGQLDKKWKGFFN
jgi:hypothetical protein